MAEQGGTRVKLGLFVVLGSALLIIGLYLLGNKRDMFSRTVEVSATFRQVSGLRVGNNVRYVGIDVGTVKRLEIISDTSITVHMTLREKAARHVRSTAIARIASDGLMGNKLVDLEPGGEQGTPITNGTQLMVGRSLDTDAMLRTLSGSNDNLAAITTDLRQVTRRLSGEGGFLNLLGDTVVMEDVRGALHELRSAASNARRISERVDHVVSELEQGRGALGALAADPGFEAEVRDMVKTLQQVGDSLRYASGELGRFSNGLNDPDGTLYALSRDTVLANDLRRIIKNLDTSSVTLNEDLKAMQHNFLLRGYFKHKEP